MSTSRSRPARLFGTALLAGVVVVLAASPSTARPSADPAGRSQQWMEAFSPDGTVTQVKVTPKPPASHDAEPAVAADVVTVQQTGPTGQRFNLVFVGDGYTRDEIGTFHQHVVSKWNELAAVEPFRTYKDSFNVWEVDAVSRESGVSEDPRGTHRDTALDMGFYCRNTAPETQRLLCVDDARANQFARLAPAVDQVIALGNTATYGGAGGGIATVAGGNPQAGQIAVHELGHSIGHLADEYDYPNDSYTGGEVAESNVSVYSAAKLQQSQLKWYRWIGQVSPDGGEVGAFGGARYYRHGINRPTDNSIMRNLGRQFNLPGREALTKAIKAKAPAVSAGDGELATRTTTAGPVTVNPTYPATISWFLDGVERPTLANATTVDPAALHTTGTHILSVRVLDTTGFELTPTPETRSWTITG